MVKQNVTVVQASVKEEESVFCHKHNISSKYTTLVRAVRGLAGPMLLAMLRTQCY